MSSKRARAGRLGRIGLSLALVGVGGALASACSGEEAQFEISFAHPISSTTPLRFSVLGVYRDGRLSQETWSAIDRGLGMGGCAVGFGAELKSKAPKLYAETDSYARRNGPDDPLFAPFASFSEGDSLLLLQVIGRPPVATSPSAGPIPTADPMGASGGGMGRGPGARMGSSLPRGAPRKVEEQPTFDVIATVWSTVEKKVIAAVAMRYSGHSMDEALGKFRDKLLFELPGAKCVGWHFGASTADSAAPAASASASAPGAAAGSASASTMGQPK
jgi:hypothetical protein